jgi:hypothetical protein
MTLSLHRSNASGKQRSSAGGTKILRVPLYFYEFRTQGDALRQKRSFTETIRSLLGLKQHLVSKLEPLLLDASVNES